MAPAQKSGKGTKKVPVPASGPGTRPRRYKQTGLAEAAQDEGIPSPDTIQEGRKTNGKGRKKNAATSQAGETDEFTKIQWQSPDFHHLTDTLITLVEDDEYAWTALGFAPGKGVNAGKTNGEKQTYYHKKYATKVLKSDPTGLWATADEGKLAIAIKNRISQLKKAFATHKKTMGATGAGLENEDEIRSGSEIQNKWDEIKKEFPWFYRVRDLIGRDPRLETTVINAASDVDIDLLGRSSHSRATSGDLIDDDFLNELEEPDDNDVPPAVNSDREDQEEAGSPGYDKGDEGQDPTPMGATEISKAPERSLKRKERIPSAPAMPIPQYGNKKSKGLLSELTETLNRDRDAKLEAAKAKARTRIKVEELRQQGNLKLEKLRLAAEQQKQEHEEKMMRMRLEFAQVQYGYHSGVGSSFGGGSSFGVGSSTGILTSTAPAAPAGHPSGPSNIPHSSPTSLANSPFLMAPAAAFDTPSYAPSISGDSYVGLLLNNDSSSDGLQ
ncbi:hypothetical protein FRB90_006316 [Tulasnella sp. 427]|nr:hypothetical protein FRB90_006316 [Tulasnella sp. 427]